MEKTFHRFAELFESLGLASDDKGIAEFLARHSPLAPEVKLEDATFWTESQSTALRKCLEIDSDWAGIVDQLNLALRA
jgi:hypothetical protein